MFIHGIPGEMYTFYTRANSFTWLLSLNLARCPPLFGTPSCGWLASCRTRAMCRAALALSPPLATFIRLSHPLAVPCNLGTAGDTHATSQLRALATAHAAITTLVQHLRSSTRASSCTRCRDSSPWASAMPSRRMSTPTFLRRLVHALAGLIICAAAALSRAAAALSRAAAALSRAAAALSRAAAALSRVPATLARASQPPSLPLPFCILPRATPCSTRPFARPAFAYLIALARAGLASPHSCRLSPRRLSCVPSTPLSRRAALAPP
ncbi:hypothetical protein DENSPDRAFT_930817, partial [Dentipellis sp. KUC8613]